MEKDLRKREGPTVVDNDKDEVRVDLRLDGREEPLRIWYYETDAQRRANMVLAREFAEGFFVASERLGAYEPSEPSLSTGALQEQLITLRDRVKSGSREDGDLLATAINRLQEQHLALVRVVGSSRVSASQPAEAPAPSPGPGSN